MTDATEPCLGIHVDIRRNNPYAPSAIKIKFALASSLKYLAITAGPKFMQQLSAIQGESYAIRDWQSRDTMDNWNTIIAKSSVDRNVRHMITGNLLQAYASYRGNLVSYTTMDGAEKKGILMADAWIPKQGGESIQVPIGKAARFVKSLTIGSPIFTNADVSCANMIAIRSSYRQAKRKVVSSSWTKRSLLWSPMESLKRYLLK